MSNDPADLPHRSILAQPEVGAVGVVVVDVFANHAAKLPLVDRDHMVETIPSQTPDLWTMIMRRQLILFSTVCVLACRPEPFGAPETSPKPAPRMAPETSNPPSAGTNGDALSADSTCPTDLVVSSGKPPFGVDLLYCEATGRGSLHMAGSKFLFQFKPSFNLHLAVSDGTHAKATFAQHQFGNIFVIYFACGYGEELWVEERHVALFRKAESMSELELLWTGSELIQIDRDSCVYYEIHALDCQQGQLSITLNKTYEWVDDGPIADWCVQHPGTSTGIAYFSAPCP